MKYLWISLFFLVFTKACVTGEPEALTSLNSRKEELHFAPGVYHGRGSLHLVNSFSADFKFKAKTNNQDLTELTIHSSEDNQKLGFLKRSGTGDSWQLVTAETKENWLEKIEPIPFLSIAELMTIPKSAVDEQWHTYLTVNDKKMQTHLKAEGEQIKVQITDTNFLLSLNLKKD